ncbi:ABC transporter permease [uncultured Nitratireductor sp.]|uniref:ABC transporter permease n=1 Tax=uncultured Nitratireductor sp. TaxID=520953 RepID=UPI0025E58B34|nr:ABC transporter permease [uncultured Nitratireductor sp.]
MLSPLDRKLLRDLWRVKGQATAIAAVIALGVMLLVMMDGLVNSLQETKDTYYERHRLADVFAPVKRAPDRVLDDLKAIPGVSAVVGRVNGAALIDLPAQEVPIRAQVVSLPRSGDPILNGYRLAEGRRIDSDRDNEVLLLKAFADARGLSPGDDLTATINGARRIYTIAGLAQSPEFVYTTPPGELAPDDARFAVLWMNKPALEALYDLDGAFNEAILALGRGAKLPAVLGQADRILRGYGGTGAYGLEDQVSNRFLSEEITSLRASSRGVPPIFLGVAAFLLNIVVSRMIQSERSQIGLLKAFGYGSAAVSAHYLKFILVIAVGGAVAGCLLGILAGVNVAGFYQTYYKFPFLLFRVDPAAFLVGILVSVAAASAGGIFVLRGVFVLAPATAMRPPVPADYSRSAGVVRALGRWLDQPSRMIARRLIRQPGKSVTAVLSIAAGMALSVAMLTLMSGFDRTVRVNFSLVDRSDVTVTFAEPLSRKAVHELQSIKGVVEVEPFRDVDVVLRNGLHAHRGAISGRVAEPRLNRAIDDGTNTIFLRRDGLILSEALAETLHIEPGETLTVEVREGRRPILRLPVIGVTEAFIGAPAYLQLDALNRVLGEPNRVSGSYLRTDSIYNDHIYRELKNSPAIAGVSLTDDTRASLRKLLDTGAGAMRYIMAAIAAIITFGIVYNSARIAFAEREQELASLRVMGFTRGEAAFVLLGELAVITFLALPIGSGLGYYLSHAVAAGFSTDLYRIPVMFDPASYGSAIIAVLIAAFLSGWVVKRDVDHLDMVAALKSRD